MSEESKRIIKRQARILEVLENKNQAKKTLLENRDNLERLMGGLDVDIRHLESEFGSNKATLLNLHLEGKDD